MPILRLLVVATFVIVTGCEGSPARNAFVSADDLKATDNESLCKSYAALALPKFENELRRRNAFTEREWQAIKQRGVYKGMPIDAFYCSWGGSGPPRKDSTKSWYGAKRKIGPEEMYPHLHYRGQYSHQVVFFQDGKVLKVMNKWRNKLSEQKSK